MFDIGLWRFRIGSFYGRSLQIHPKLPWVTNQLTLQITRNKRLHNKCKTNRSLISTYKSSKQVLQLDMRKAYWIYIGNMIFDLPINQITPSYKKKHSRNYTVTSKVQKTTIRTFPPYVTMVPSQIVHKQKQTF
jgi:hypothetical protein